MNTNKRGPRFWIGALVAFSALGWLYFALPDNQILLIPMVIQILLGKWIAGRLW